MKSADIYKGGYEFAKKADAKKRKLLLVATIAFPIIILLVLAVGFVSSLDSFNRAEKVSEVFPDVVSTEKLVEQNRQLTEAYADAGIPYSDPQNRFSIVFVTPYVSDQILVVIYTDKDYDKVRTEAETIIGRAQQKVPINSISYKNVF